LILLGTGIQRAGKSSRVVTEGETLAFSSWQVTASAKELETLNFTSFVQSAYSGDGETPGQSYEEGIMGPLSAKFSFGGDWDAGTNPLDITAPPGLYPRDNLSDTFLYENVIDDVLWQFSWARIRGAINGAQADSKVTFSVSDASSQGAFIMPIGSI